MAKYPLVAAIIAVVCVRFAQGHGYLTTPPSRNYLAWHITEYTPQALNSKPQLDQWKATGARSWEMSPNPAFPHNLIESVANSARHGVCGDPGQSEMLGTNLYGQSNSIYSVGASVSGSTIDITVGLTAHHEGFFEFELCDVGTTGIVTQQCFQNTPLTRAAGGFATPLATAVDPAYPGRFYIGPASCNPSMIYTIRYALPSITCSHCVLRWHYVTGNNCFPTGYAAFRAAATTCAPSIYGGLASCGAPPSYPEEFWNCADLAINNGGGAPSPVPPPPPPTPLPTVRSPTAPGPMPTTAPAPTAAPVGSTAGCGTCTNCYFAPTSSCFVGWTAGQCASVATYTWCGAGSPPAPSPAPTAKPATVPTLKPTTAQPAAAKTPAPSNAKPVVAPTVPAPTRPPVCGSCTNCLYVAGSSCTAGWTKQDCASTSWGTWCG